MTRSNNNPECLWNGTHLTVVRHDQWESVQRRGTTGIVAIVALTDERNLVLIEQFRPPVQQRVIEIPAGLAGDVPGQQDEPLQTAAERELFEETGYRATHWREVCHGVTSAGLTNEAITLFLATGLKKVGTGGGDHTEDIQVHEIDLDQVDKWLQHKQQTGNAIDIKLYTALYFAKQQ